MKEKKVLKWIVLIILFVIIAFCFIKITTYIMKPMSVDLENIAGLYGEKKNSLDMVYIGGSACFVYWEPLRAFEKDGIASYNYGANTIQPECYKTMIKEILKTQKPELIVIDARAFQYRESKQPPTEVAYRNVLTGMPLSLNKIQFIQDNVKKYLEDDEISYYFDIMKYHRETKGQLINQQIKMAFNLYNNPVKGFLLIPKVEKQTKPNIKTMKEKAVDKQTEEIFLDLLEYIKTTECNYLFIVSPYVEEEEHKENFNYMERIVKEYGYEFLDSNDYYEEMKLNFETDLYNDAHVNIFGADKYTDFLTQYIKKNYQLPDRKQEYQDWNELLPNWNSQVQQTKIAINQLILLQQ